MCSARRPCTAKVRVQRNEYGSVKVPLGMGGATLLPVGVDWSEYRDVVTDGLRSRRLGLWRARARMTWCLGP
jgi:hypothetical protein